jgi:hypothetical protein
MDVANSLLERLQLPHPTVVGAGANNLGLSGPAACG